MSAATGVSLSGPGAVFLNVASKPFTIALTPLNGTAAGDVVTPATNVTDGLGHAGATFSPAAPALNTANPSSTFTMTPTVAGTHSLSITDTATLSMSGPLSVVVIGDASSLEAITGDAANPVKGGSFSLTPNQLADVLCTIAHLPEQITAPSLKVKLTDAAGSAALTKSGLIIDPGTLQSDGTYTALVLFHIVEGDTTTALIPGVSYSYSVQVTTLTTSHTVVVAEAGRLSALTGGPGGG